MANRYCNLTPSKKISEDFQNINLGFDAVQTDVDANKADVDDHIADNNRHWTAADRTKFSSIEPGAQVNDVTSVAGKTGDVEIVWSDVQGRPSSAVADIDDAVGKRHTHSNKAILDATEQPYTTADKSKLDGIEPGAQANQPAFGQINDVQAGNPTDTLNIAGGTGITVTTNPTSKTVTITATGTSTPGAHGSSHVTGGADPIPEATTTTGGLMSAADKSKLDGATSAATPNTLVQRDANGRFKAGAPAAADDVARKADLEDIISPSAVYFDMQDKYRAWQGVATDGNYIYVVTDRNENFDLENIISVYTMDGVFVSEKRHAYTGTDSAGRFMSFGDCSVIDGYLYVPVYNINSGGPAPYESKIVKYSLPDLDFVSDVDIGSGVAECVTKYLDDFWVCYHDAPIIKRFSSDFTLKNTYPLSQELGPEGGYQSIFWIDDFVYLNMHGSNEYGKAYAPGLDKYSFDGANFTFVERIKPPTYGSGQGVSKFGDKFYWNDRPGNKVIITNGLKSGNLIPYSSESSSTVLLGSLGLGAEPGIHPASSGRRFLTVKGESNIGVVELASGGGDAEHIPVGSIQYVDANCTGTDKRIGNLACYLEGATPNNRGGRAAIALKPDNGNFLIERFAVHSDGIVDINNQSSFRAYQSVAQSVAANTDTKILFQTKDYDNQTEFDSTSSVFTAKRAGIYMVSCGVGFTQPASNRVTLTVYKNGQPYETLADITSAAAQDASFTGSTIIKLNAGDYLEIFLISSNPVTCFNISPRTFFSAIKIA